MRTRRPLALTASVALLALLGSVVPAAAEPRDAHPRHHRPPLAGTVAAASGNWAGYEVVGAADAFTQVSASWIQPTATCGPGATNADFWVGLDGAAGGNTVEQTGTGAYCRGGGRVEYGAWYEMYPDGPVYYNDPVKPGDQIRARVTYLDDGSFELVLQDVTQNWIEITRKKPTHGRPVLRRSAEVIAETPGDSGPLTDFGTLRFSRAQVDGTPIGNLDPIRVHMTRQGGGGRRATTSPLTDGTDFTVTWLSP
ncbi:G1 family glutamic endopeptidase [Kitasatospora sp. NPDC054939]